MKKSTQKIITIISILIFFVTIYFIIYYKLLKSYNNILEDNNEIFKYNKIKNSNIFIMNNTLCIDNKCLSMHEIIKVYFSDNDYKIAIIDNSNNTYMRYYKDKFSYEEIKNDITKSIITYYKMNAETLKYVLLVLFIVIIIGIIFIGG